MKNDTEVEYKNKDRKKNERMKKRKIENI